MILQQVNDDLTILKKEVNVTKSQIDESKINTEAKFSSLKTEISDLQEVSRLIPAAESCSELEEYGFNETKNYPLDFDGQYDGTKAIQATMYDSTFARIPLFDDSTR